MRLKTIKNLYDKVFDIFNFTGLWKLAMGMPETNGCWIIYGDEKNGKTWFALLLAYYLSGFKRVLYISAEEGTGMTFVDACKRAQIPVNAKNLHFEEYIPLEEVSAKIASRKGAEIVFIDNTTFYADELKGGMLFDLIRKKHPDKLFVLLAHAEKGEPKGAIGKQAKKLAKIIMRVEGLTAFISGRCPGGIISIDETKSALYWGATA